MVSKNNILISTSQIIAAYVSRASVAPEQLTVLVEEIYKKLLQLSDDTTNSILTVNCNVPCIDPKDSITDEYLICLEDGKKFKSLRRHLMSHYNMTPEQYIVVSGIYIQIILW
ncbi:MucR family transcriptional regulator [Bartonella sp. DGB1]|uniref:MucR family transcriptional regulator n=1 Tax=Bartonella sp. DGB1 TaxID=3239807 RepID=UPI00352589AB